MQYQVSQNDHNKRKRQPGRHTPSSTSNPKKRILAKSDNNNTSVRRFNETCIVEGCTNKADRYFYFTTMRDKAVAARGCGSHKQRVCLFDTKITLLCKDTRPLMTVVENIKDTQVSLSLMLLLLVC